jgi:hypothetical protein
MAETAPPDRRSSSPQLGDLSTAKRPKSREKREDRQDRQLLYMTILAIFDQPEAWLSPG